MALFLLSTSLGNIMIAAVNSWMVKPLHAKTIEAGDETWVAVEEANQFIVGQKIDFTGEVGLQVVKPNAKPTDKPVALEGTYLVSAIDPAGRLRLMDVVERKPVKTVGAMNPKAEISTYYLVGPNYFYFFIGVMCVMGVIFIFVAMAYKEKTHVREGDPPAAAA